MDAGINQVCSEKDRTEASPKTADLPYYKEFIKNFDNKALVCLLNLMDDPILLMDLDTAKANRRFKKLCAAHGSHCKNVFIVDALNYLATCSEPLSKVHKTTAFKDLLSKVNSQF